MRDFWLLLAGGALAIAGSIVAQWLQARDTKRQWERERDERRLLAAADDLAKARTMVKEFRPLTTSKNYNGLATREEHEMRVDQWREVRPELERLAILDPTISREVDLLIANVGLMLEVNAIQIG